MVAGVKGSLAGSVGLIYDTLLTSSLDEVSTGYGLLAESVSYPDDFSSASYRLRAEAKWHDGTPVTPDDVIFSFDGVQEIQPVLLPPITGTSSKSRRPAIARSPSPSTVPATANCRRSSASSSSCPRHWWEGTDKNGKKRDIGETTLEPPLGSGAYRIKDFSPGRTIVYERVKDYWGKDLNVNIGRNNFDELRFEYFRDTTVALEAFKADTVDWRNENSAKNWATAYDFPAVTDKRVITRGISDQ